MSYGAGSRQIRPLPNRQRTRKADNFNRVDSHHDIDEIINFVRHRQSTILEREPTELRLHKKAPLPRIGEVPGTNCYSGDENSNSSEGLNDHARSSSGSMDTDTDPAYESDPEIGDREDRLRGDDGMCLSRLSGSGGRGRRSCTPSLPARGEVLQLRNPHHHRTPSSNSSRTCSEGSAEVHSPGPVPPPRRARSEWSDGSDVQDEEEDLELFSADGTCRIRPDAPSPSATPPPQDDTVFSSQDEEEPVDYIDIH